MNYKTEQMRAVVILQVTFMLGLFGFKPAIAQQTSGLTEPVYLLTDEKPTFPGGDVGLQKYFDDNLHIKIEEEYKFVTISFIVMANGQVADVRFVKGFAPKTNPGIDSTVVQVARKMPSWQPGLVKGKAVNTRLLFPVKLQ